MSATVRLIAAARTDPLEATMSTRASLGLALLLALLLALAACGSPSEDERSTAVTGDTASAVSPSPGDETADKTEDGASLPGRPVETSAGIYRDLNADELAEMLGQKDFVHINVHIPYEGEIEQTDLFIPYDEASQRVSELPEDKKAKIVVYCRSDRMSRIAVEEWLRAGYTDLYNLQGGFVAWQAAGYELLQK
jgi:rhodanese-related sulfurtransferase